MRRLRRTIAVQRRVMDAIKRGKLYGALDAINRQRLSGFKVSTD